MVVVALVVLVVFVVVAVVGGHRKEFGAVFCLMMKFPGDGYLLE